MKLARPAGPHAAARKYDILTALGAFACAGDKHLQRLVLRFITLIVARYNWLADELAVGQAEIAALWAVDERTVKREMARLRDMGWLVVKRPAARGRVAVHGLDIEAVRAVTEPAWGAVGPDFAARMGGQGAAASAPNVVAFPRAAVPEMPPGASGWDRARARLQAEDGAIFAAWFAPLRLREAEGGAVDLVAPSRFHASFVATHHLGRLTAALRDQGLGLGGVTVSA